jgi:hypothetical protein
MPNAFNDILHEETQQWLAQLPQELGERKYRLLLAACCRYVFQRKVKLPGDVAEALELLESFADTGKGKTALRDFRRKTSGWGNRRTGFTAEYRGLYDALDPKLANHQPLTAFAFAIQAAHKVSGADAVAALRRLHADLVPPSAGAEELPAACRTPAVVELASSMYQARDFGDMPRLAEALEQAGCTNRELLEHCRADVPHLRGCWAVDAVLAGGWTKAASPRAKVT